MHATKIISNEQIVRLNKTEDLLYVCELKGPYTRKSEENETPAFHYIILTQRGSIGYILNGQKGEVIQGSVLNIPPWTNIAYLKYSADFMGMLVSVNNRMMVDIVRNRNPFPKYFGFKMRYMTHISLSAKESRAIALDIKSLYGCLGNHGHFFLHELTYAHFYILLIDLADTVWKRFGEGKPLNKVETSRKEKLFNDLIAAIHENIYNETTTGFYADKLCISKQYLALIVKDMIHIPVGQLISHIRYETAARLLTGTSMTIQQISDRMSFSDQSSFGKFFKRQGGQSPMEYRKSLRKNLLTTIVR